ncbi:MAG: Gfo/Idh/MocA family oxidoreductase [Lachnospiraceae bacterium]|nr:Gfo/Idh/MocA family oxidoreductase [Lachnospiraceae bacterium]
MKIIVIGLGSMGRRRIRLLKGTFPQYEIIGVDSNEERVRNVMNEFHIACYDSIEKAKNNEKIDCAFVCTSPLSHATIIGECLQNEWNVFTEINLIDNDYDKNVQLALDKDKLLFLSSTPIYRAEMRKIKEEIDKNGKKISYLYHVGQYLPDWHPWENFQQFFVGDKRTNGCREIFAIELPWMIRTFGSIEKIRVVANKLTDLPIDYRDNYLVQIEHENGTCGTFHVDVACRQAVRHLEIYNEELYIEWNGTPETLRYKNIETNAMELLDSTSQYHHEDGYSTFVNEYAYVNEMKEFFEVLSGEKKAEYGFNEDKETLQWIDRIESI